jgi:hypothetical protein
MGSAESRRLGWAAARPRRHASLLRTAPLAMTSQSPVRVRQRNWIPKDVQLLGCESVHQK